ncbi:MAG TPA: 1-(5-phosphoribosyl)-5-amino-4-imidazole-carboxylate carboxylase, partial [Eubacteriaceae bacterium]|nr:1-(5-phosphoribosyl)-5-amino-4-imidazole-carboxylate carboxylase [Eubacteriaceae bacterium]
MNKKEIMKLLEAFRQEQINEDECAEKLSEIPYKELGYATIDNHREIRNGYPEVIYCEGKTPEQIKGIVDYMAKGDSPILATRADKNVYESLAKDYPNAVYNELGRVITIAKEKIATHGDSYIAIVCAGTSDLPVVEEAAETAKILGNRIKKITDVGVAGIHRLMGKMEEIRGAKVVIVVAGMEGALA